MQQLHYAVQCNVNTARQRHCLAKQHALAAKGLKEAAGSIPISGLGNLIFAAAQAFASTLLA